jgi:hypothetical protein
MRDEVDGPWLPDAKRENEMERWAAVPQSIQKRKGVWATVARHADENRMGNEATVAFNCLRLARPGCVLFIRRGPNVLTDKYAKRG